MVSLLLAAGLAELGSGLAGPMPHAEVAWPRVLEPLPPTDVSPPSPRRRPRVRAEAWGPGDRRLGTPRRSLAGLYNPGPGGGR